MSQPIPRLPIDDLLPLITETLKTAQNLVIEAAPGAGKTTRVPPALLSVVAGGVVVLEPRRIAARLAAQRVAHERGERAGETVGYQVRFEEAIGPRTRLRFITEGVLTRRFLSDPGLGGVDVVLLDEFHERHLDSDLALALLKRLQRTRPELRIVVMSATLDAEPIARYLGCCAVVRAKGRAFPLAIQHTPYSPQPLETQARDALQALLPGREAGHVLVFVPGAAEIRRTIRACEPLARSADASLLPLHGELSWAEQDLAVAPSARRKIVVATNVAESSITIDGVTAVIDSGLARVSSQSPWSGLPGLHVGRISKASAVQRAGRAGRTAPGTAVRLYSLEDFAQRPDHDTPEILRSDLSGLCLALRAMGVEHASLEWLDPPPEGAVLQAECLLDRLGAHGARAGQLAKYPLPPRLSRLLIEAVERGAGEEGIAAAALLASGRRWERTDLLSALDLPPDTHVLQHRAQLRRLARPSQSPRRNDEALLLSVLRGFPDRVARLRGGHQILLSTGIAAEIAGERPLYEFMVALDAENRSDQKLPVVRMVARIEPEWLIDLFPGRVREETALAWDRSAERVDAVTTLRYDELILQEWRDARPDPVAAATLLHEKAMEAGMASFVDASALEEMLARIAFAGLAEPSPEAALRELCTGLRSFADLRRVAGDLLHLVENAAGAEALRQLAPPSLRLGSGRQTKIHFERGKPPWIASRLQDFFGMRETPRIGQARTPVVVHLLAPNHRAVQTTTDLAGFWERLYPQVRRELMRRYPRHLWPESP